MTDIGDVIATRNPPVEPCQAPRHPRLLEDRSRGRSMTSETRLSVNINATTADALRDFAQYHEISATKALHLLIGYGTAVERADRAGKPVLIVDGHRQERMVLLCSDGSGPINP